MLMPSRIASIEWGGVSIQPDCPTCDGATVRRTATSGPRAGTEFWGCVNFPHCQGSVAVAANVRSAAARLREAAPATTYRPSTGAVLTGLARPADVAGPVADDDPLAAVAAASRVSTSADEPAEWDLRPRSIAAMRPVMGPVAGSVPPSSSQTFPSIPVFVAARPDVAPAEAVPFAPAGAPAGAPLGEPEAPNAAVPDDLGDDLGDDLADDLGDDLTGQADPADQPVAMLHAGGVGASRIATAGPAAATGLRAAIAGPMTVARRSLARLAYAAAGVLAPWHTAAPRIGRNIPGASAQAEFERRATRHRAAVQAALPTVVAVTILGMAAAVIAFGPYGRLIAALGAAAVGLVGASFIGRLPPDAIRWRSHAAAERLTASSLQPLESAGYIVLHDRTVPGIRPNIDHIAIGPAGVFVIETRQLRGRLAIVGEKLFVGERTRTGLVEATYREAVAVQIALSDTLGPAQMTVQPIVCVHGTPQLLLDNEIQGLRVVSGAELVPFLRRQPVVLGAEAVQTIAATTDRRLRPATP